MGNAPPKFNSSPLKNGGWRVTFLLVRFSVTFQGLFQLNFGRASFNPYKWSYFTLQKALVFGPTLAVTYVRKLTGADRLMVVAPPPTASNSLATVCGRGTTGLQVPQFEGETETTKEG